MSVRLLAAGSLRRALPRIIAEFTRASGVAVQAEIGPSGLLRQRIEAGEEAHLLASADLGHPERLWRAGLAQPPIVFARNALCLMAAPGFILPPERLVETLLDPATRLTTSTPGADPSGDYTWELFRRAERVLPGAFERLAAKAVQAVGGQMPVAPQPGPSPVGRLFLEGLTDVFVGYRTSALALAAEVTGVSVVELPPELAVATRCGLAVMRAAPAPALALALAILGATGQAVLAEAGFTPVWIGDAPSGSAPGAGLRPG
jgi:ABC-type molybdate transport system substrate-binding protein